MPRVSPEYTEARKDQILDAAMGCFVQKGFNGASMKDIIAASELSAGAIYNYFGSKDDIIDAIARKRHAREQAMLGEALEPAPPRALADLARAFFSTFASEAARSERRLGIEVWAEALRNPRVLKTVRRGIDEPVRVLAEVVVECQARGELPKTLLPEGIARLMVAVFQGFVLQQAWEPDLDTEVYMGAVDAVLSALGQLPEEG
ncbi:MAG: TetR/AcrR family transcriptional regulator [Myxococcota bacterium]